MAEMIAAGMQHCQMRLPQPTRVPDERLASRDLPVLTNISGKSVIHDPQVAAATSRRSLARGTVDVFPDALHAINGEYPDEIAAAIDSVIDVHRRARPGTGSPLPSLP